MEVYLDNSSTTKIDPKVWEEMAKAHEIYGNPSSVHKKGQEARVFIEKKRDKISQLLGCESSEIVFTASGTEANNMALKGVLKKGDHILTTPIEHSSILNTLDSMEGIEIGYIPVDEKGVVDIKGLKDLVQNNTKLVSVMHANNETGVIQPIFNIRKMLNDHIPIHVDGVQSIGKISENPIMAADFCSISPHKFYGPKGIGILFIRRDTPFHKLINGGDQERNRRGGTENIVGIAGACAALEIAIKNPEYNKTLELREYLEKSIESKIKGVHINCHSQKRLPGIANIYFEKTTNDMVLFNLDKEGIFASAGSACSSGSIEPSHVLKAMGLSTKAQNGSIRFSLGKYNTKEEIDFTTDRLKKIIERLRK